MKEQQSSQQMLQQSKPCLDGSQQPLSQRGSQGFDWYVSRETGAQSKCSWGKRDNHDQIVATQVVGTDFRDGELNQC